MEYDEEDLGRWRDDLRKELMSRLESAIESIFDDDDLILVSHKKFKDKDYCPSFFSDENGVYLYTSLDLYDADMISAKFTLSDVLESSREVYECGDDGWGIKMIRDYKKIIKALNEEINKMKKEINEGE